MVVVVVVVVLVVVVVVVLLVIVLLVLVVKKNNNNNTSSRRERATIEVWFLKENNHTTLKFTLFYAPEGSEMLVKRSFLFSSWQTLTKHAQAKKKKARSSQNLRRHQKNKVRSSQNLHRHQKTKNKTFVIYRPPALTRCSAFWLFLSF